MKKIFRCRVYFNGVRAKDIKIEVTVHITAEVVR